MADLGLDKDHPLALELTSLRDAVARYQHEAHAASVKLQRHSLDTSHAIEHARALEVENARLRDEVEALRAHPDTTPHPTALQVPELTLALRKLSDKLTFTEETLLSRATEVAHIRSELAKVQGEKDAALVATRSANTAIKQSEHRERELARQARAAEEERKLADLVVKEYAALVRKLEGRPSHTRTVSREEHAPFSQSTPVGSLAEGKLGLQKLFMEFSGENEQLASELSKSQSEVTLLREQLNAEQQRSEADRESLGKMIVELDKYKADDNTAAKMVSRYMKFSQSTTDALQTAMDNLRTRHAATIATLNAQIAQLQTALLSEQRQSEKLREALDQLSEDISREAYGRRREISLRLAFLGREETLSEKLHRWVRKSREMVDRVFAQTGHPQDSSAALYQAFTEILHGAEDLLGALDGKPSVDSSPQNGSVGRILSAQNAVTALIRELQHESRLRVEAQSLLAQAADTHQPAPGVSTLPLTLPRSTSSLNVQDEPIEVRVDEQLDLDPSELQAIKQNDLPSLDHISDVFSSLTDPVVASAASPVLELAPLSTSSGDVFPESPKTPIQPPSDESSCEPSALSLSPDPSIIVDMTVATGGTSTSFPIDRVSPSLTKTPLDSPTDDLGRRHPDSPKPLPSAAPAVEMQELPGFDIRELPSDTPMEFVTTTDEEPQRGVVASLTPLLVPESTSGTPAGILFTPSPVDPGFAHPLMSELQLSKQRYDNFQKAFRDCSMALKELKKDLEELPSSLEMTTVIRTAVERLNDFNEDTRVELEIRVADEERIISGYEALLSVPGAMAEVDEASVKEEIGAFVESTNPIVAKSMDQFNRKLDDLQHDIASVKRTLHELSAGEAASPASPEAKSTSGWTSWTGSVFGGSRPVSPAPTFGSVMTTPRARQSSFGAFLHRPSLPNLHDRGGTSNSPTERESPFAALGLRIPMPTVVLPQASPSRGLFLSPGMSSTHSRPQKPRAASSPMYMLGLGIGSTSHGFPTSAKLPHAQSKLVESSDGEGSQSAGGDSDVE
ncbi:hypothetical protein BDW22DRAFT_1029908 [Trametopsis cervina]|nr:hypothetical protein BDW22DRAFT_1029908 [Trametopsis cervina]